MVSSIVEWVGAGQTPACRAIVEQPGQGEQRRSDGDSRNEEHNFNLQLHGESSVTE